MKKLLTIVLALLMLVSACAYAQPVETVQIGKYTLVIDGSYEYAVNDSEDVNIYFYDQKMGANSQYMAINLADFAAAGLDTPTALADFFLDSMLNSDSPLLADMVKEYTTYGDIVCIEYYGNVVVSEGGGCYAGIILVDDNSLLSFLSIPTDATIGVDTARSTATAYLNTIQLNGTYVVDMGGAVDLTERYGSIGDAFAAEETGIPYTLGTHTVYAPSGWVYASSNESQLSFFADGAMILMGVYEFGDSSTMETARSLDPSDLAELLTTSTNTGLEGTGLDVSTFTLSTVYYNETEPVICFDGNASAVMSDPDYAWLTGATLLTDTDMAMIMIFSNNSNPTAIDTYLWDAVGMLLD